MLEKTLKANALDRRTATARMLGRIKADLIRDAGGPAHVTARELVLIERTAALILLCGSIENYVFAQKELVDKQGKLPGILSQHYVAFTNSVRLNLVALHLRPDKNLREVELEDYLQERGAQ